jgi:tyrosinase
MAETTRTTRYVRVKEILDAAAGASTADYGGIGRPWHLPLARFTTVEVYGVRMIAPPAPASAPAALPVRGGCGCGCATGGQDPDGDPPGARVPPHPGRGAASGLVRGLRGEAPYDGSVFPRLPWGGAGFVADDDVAFIADWIDDGCPGDDAQTVVAVEAERAEAIAEAPRAGAPVEPAVLRVQEAWEAPAPEPRRPGELRQRLNLDCMTVDQVDALRAGFRELYGLNKWPLDRRSYNNIALIHQNHCQHGWERFLPWHRVYLYELEQALHDVVPGVVLPYWDWTMARYRPHCPEKGDIIPRAYQGFLTGASVDWLQGEAKPPLDDAQAAAVRETMLGKTYARLSDFFADVAKIDPALAAGAHRERFIDALLDTNALWYPLRYPAQYHTSSGKPSTINKVIHYHYPTGEDMAQIQALRTFRDFGGGSLYNDSFGFLDQNPHNTMHIWTGGMNPATARPQPTSVTGDAGVARNRAVRVTGRRFHTRSDMYVEQDFGDMFSNLTASYDPIFWPIHVNIDRVWSEWQEVNPAALPADTDSVLTPWSYTIADTLDIARFGYEYVKSAALIPVGPETPVGRFVSRPVEIPADVRAGFRTAEVRLHRVPQLDRSCFVRVFLDVPDANADTPLDHPGYAGYLAVFGHGPCIGGPGHCGVPERRPFDLRPRSHNTPRNHRVNVTRTARRLLEAGATQLRITLVVVGVDYCEDTELLRLEGVSLNFLD